MKAISSRPEAGSRARWQARLYAMAVTMVLAATEALAQEQAQAAKAAETAEPTLATRTWGTERPEPTREVIVSIPDRKLALVEGGEVVRVYPVAVGKKSTPSPTGEFTVKNRVTNPTYYHKGQVIPVGPQNPVGTRWIGLSQKGYGIHGTNEPRSIGKAASHGCIRMAKADLEELFEILRSGDKVSIRGERDEEIAQIFGGEPVIVAAVVATSENPHPSKTGLDGAPAVNEVPANADGRTVVATLQLGPATAATGGIVGWILPWPAAIWLVLVMPKVIAMSRHWWCEWEKSAVSHQLSARTGRKLKGMMGGTYGTLLRIIGGHGGHTLLDGTGDADRSRTAEADLPLRGARQG